MDALSYQAARADSRSFRAKSAVFSPKLSDDPLIDLIERYKVQLRIYNEHAPDDSDEADLFAARTFGPLWDQICSCPPAPTTFAGAVAGLEFINDELRDCSFSEALKTVLRRSLGFFRQMEAN